MDKDNTFPMDIPERDSGSRPWKFRPNGYLVVILSNLDEGKRAESTLVEKGFAPDHIKLYEGKKTLENFTRYLGQRTVADRAMGTFADDLESRDLYLGYAREDRCAMWVRIPDEGKVPKALRVLADFDYLHTRYYGGSSQHDINVS